MDSCLQVKGKEDQGRKCNYMKMLYENANETSCLTQIFEYPLVNEQISNSPKQNFLFLLSDATAAVCMRYKQTSRTEEMHPMRSHKACTHKAGTVASVRRVVTSDEISETHVWRAGKQASTYSHKRLNAIKLVKRQRQHQSTTNDSIISLSLLSSRSRVSSHLSLSPRSLQFHFPIPFVLD